MQYLVEVVLCELHPLTTLCVKYIGLSLEASHLFVCSILMTGILTSFKLMRLARAMRWNILVLSFCRSTNSSINLRFVLCFFSWLLVNVVLMFLAYHGSCPPCALAKCVVSYQSPVPSSSRRSLCTTSSTDFYAFYGLVPCLFCCQTHTVELSSYIAATGTKHPVF